MDVNPDVISTWPNVALIPGTHTHAATGKRIPQPAYTIIGANNMHYEHEQSTYDLKDIPRMKVGYVGTFDDCTPNKDQARKILEESAEVFAAWQEWSHWEYRKDNAPDDYAVSVHAADARNWLAEECADVVQAIANLLCGLGINDLSPWLRAIENKNAERGYVYAGEKPNYWTEAEQ